MRSKVSLSPLVGRISNAEIPFVFDRILGVTGTLASLNEAERDILKIKYEIRNYSYIPSVFGDNRLDFAENSSAGTYASFSLCRCSLCVVLSPIDATDVILCTSKEDHFLELKHEIRRRRELLKRGIEDVIRPVMVFFDAKQTLLDFYESSYMQNFKAVTRTITESAPFDERMSRFQNATNRGAITLMIRDFGRGTDFKCHDKTLIDAGGVHVIQAFFSDDKSEEIQVKGRCARQGADGSYSMVINCDQLRRDLRINHEEVNIIRAGGLRWNRLNDIRNTLSKEKFKDRLAIVVSEEDLHYRTYACLMAMLKRERQSDVISFFEELNGVVGLKGAFAGGSKQAKESILTERRLRMDGFRELQQKRKMDDGPEDSEALMIEASFQQIEKARIRSLLSELDVVCHFDLLGVEFGATIHVIKEAYRILAIIFHPDKCKDEDAQAIFQAIGNAVDILLDGDRRADYIRERGASMG